MSTKKKTTAKTAAPAAKYKNGQKCYFISYHRGKPEELVECKINGVSSLEVVPTDELGKAMGPIISFAYRVDAATGFKYDKMQGELFGSFIDAAKAFTAPHLILLK